MRFFRGWDKPSILVLCLFMIGCGEKKRVTPEIPVPPECITVTQWVKYEQGGKTYVRPTGVKLHCLVVNATTGKP